METPLNGREWTNLLKHLDLFGNGIHLSDSPVALEDSPVSSEHVSVEGAGWAEVSGHRLTITDALEPGFQPWIKAEYPVLLSVNGNVVSEPVQVFASDTIEIAIEPDPMFELTVTPDRLQVILRVFRDKQFASRLVNTGPSYELTLRAETLPNEVISVLSPELVLKAADAQLIKAVIKEIDVRSEINLMSGEPVVIAEGVPPVESIDAQLEKFFEDEIRNDFLQADERDRIDFRSHMKIPSVKSGQMMARLHPPVPGKNGVDVYGAVIIPAPPKNYAIKARQYVSVVNGVEVYAVKSGRPSVKGEDILEFEVIPCFQWNGDVDFRSGNILFDGDVMINGSVMEGMTVEASGRVTVNGSVFRAMIVCSNTAVVNGNLVNGSIYAGQEPPHFYQLRMVCNEIHEQWVQWINTAKYVVHRLKKTGQPVRRGPLLMSLIQTKFPELPRRIRQWMTMEQQLTPSADSPLLPLAEAFRHVLSPGFWNEDGGLEQLEWIEQRLHQACLPPGGNLIKANIVLDQCQLSDLRASGDIMVRKEGAIQSNIVAEGNILFTDGSAICRGGQVVAGDRIVCGTLGSESGGYTMVKAGKEIVANQMNQGRIHIGRHTKEIWSPIKKMKAYIHHNSLVVAGLTD